MPGARARPHRAGAPILDRAARMGRVRSPGSLPCCRLVAVPARLDTVRHIRRPLRPGGATMKTFLVALGAGLVLAGASGAQAYHRFWANCNYDAPTFMTTMTRD